MRAVRLVVAIRGRTGEGRWTVPGHENVQLGAKNGIAPQSHVLEAAFLPTVEDILAAARSLL